MSEDATDQDAAEPSEATKREGVGRRSEAQHHAPLERGTLVGRYVAIDVLGKGGMGVVYTAFDPELDRKVAVKLLQAAAGGSTGGDQAWLLREAQAMARLAHPNVIAVHDVGTLPGNRVFVAMELVDGPTLRAWLRTEARPWRDVIAVMRQAGAGLAAAHAVGLVHRDFKPDNVLVGTDGRVRVMDFGLARLRRDDDTGVPASRSSDLEIETRSPLSEDLTIAGTVVGTPAYMAPELYKGEPADARSDQFSFGVALYEALFRVRPYDKGAFYPVPDAPPAPRTPPDTGVPAKITRVVMRAIAADPTARYPSMDALLAELALDPLIQRKRLAIGAAAMVAAIGVGAGGFLLSHHERRAEPCLGIEQRLAGVWDPAIKAAVQKAFTASGQPFAAQAYAGLEKALDGYARDWAATATDSCRATRIRRDQTEAVMVLRQDCLDQRLEELRAFTQLEQTADASLVEKGDKPVWELEPINKCSNVAALREPGAIAPALQPKVAEARKLIAEAKADLLAGRPFPGLLASQKATDLALPLNNDGIAAEALLVRGGALVLSGQGDEAVKVLAEAMWAAVRARRDDIISGAGISAAITSTEQLGKPGEAQIYIGLARAAATHLGMDHPVEHRMLLAEGVIAAQLGDDPTAISAHEKALHEAELEYGHDSLALWADEEALGATLTKSGSYVKALPHFERSLKMREASVGPDHPDVALLLSNLGVCYRHAGQLDKAHASYDRALAIREKAYGANSPMLIPTLNNYADLMKEVDPVATLPVIERALHMAERSIGKNHPLYHTVATTYAETLAAAHKWPEAHTAFDETIALETTNHSPMLPTTLTSRAQLALDEKQYAEAADLAQRAVTGLETAGGTENPELWLPLSKLGIAKAALGKKDEAKAALERSIAIAEKVKISDTELGATRAALKQLQ